MPKTFSVKSVQWYDVWSQQYANIIIVDGNITGPLSDHLVRLRNPASITSSSEYQNARRFSNNPSDIRYRQRHACGVLAVGIGICGYPVEYSGSNLMKNLNGILLEEQVPELVNYLINEGYSVENQTSQTLLMSAGIVQSGEERYLFSVTFYSQDEVKHKPFFRRV